MSTAVIACGALSVHVRAIARRRGWELDLYPVPAPLHNRPEKIAPAVEELASDLRERYERVVLAYADCGTYGALDAVCDRLGLRRLPGLHCYDLYAGADRIREFFEKQPGTYLLTDFLVRSFTRTVVQELGLDRYPELRDDYFRHYTRVVWLRQDDDAELHLLAQEAATILGLPLTVVPTGHAGLERSLRELLAETLDNSLDDSLDASDR